MTQLQAITDKIKCVLSPQNEGMCIIYTDNEETICRKIFADSQSFQPVSYDGSSLVLYTINDSYTFNIQDEEAFVDLNIYLFTKYYFEKKHIIEALSDFEEVTISGEGDPFGIYSEVFGDTDSNPFRDYAFKFTLEINLQEEDVT